MDSITEYFGQNRTRISEIAEHLFRNLPNTHFGISRTAVSALPNTHFGLSEH
jgi:hypothetical protein